MIRRVGNWFNMPCWNGLSIAQQVRLIEVGNLPFGYEPAGWCERPPEIGIETEFDRSPGPRFYCHPCSLLFLAYVNDLRKAHSDFRGEG